MSTHRRKRKQQRRNAPSVGGSPLTPYVEANKVSSFRPPRMPKPVPSELEVVAKDIHNIEGEVNMARRRIGHIQQDLSAEQQNLNRLQLEHANKTTRLRELAVLPQP